MPERAMREGWQFVDLVKADGPGTNPLLEKIIRGSCPLDKKSLSVSGFGFQVLGLAQTWDRARHEDISSLGFQVEILIKLGVRVPGVELGAPEDVEGKVARVPCVRRRWREATCVRESSFMTQFKVIAQ